MKHTTHKLTNEQKTELFNSHRELIYMVFCCGGYMLRQQMRKLFHLLSDKNEKDIEFDIAELICSGFLLQKTINRDTRTKMLYLSKYPKSQFLNVNSRDVPAINWSEQKLFEQLFRIDFIIETIIPDMEKQTFEINMDNVLAYLNWNGSNLLLSNNQMDMVTSYNHLWNAFTRNGYSPSDDFFRDLEIATYDQKSFEAKQLKKGNAPTPCIAKIRRDKEIDSYNSDIEKNKHFYHLKNLVSHGFYIEGIERNIIKICFFDSIDSIYTKKLYQQLSYILIMFQRYLNNYDIQICATVYTWDADKAEEFRNFESRQAYDFYRQEWVKENKKQKIMKDIGLLPSHWDNITVNYTSMEPYSKYNVHL